MDGSLLPVFSHAPAPVADDGRVVAARGDNSARSAFGSALGLALGDDGRTPATPTAVVPPTRCKDLRSRLRGGCDLADAPALSERSGDETSSPPAAVLAYLGLEWPQRVVPPAGLVPFGTSVGQEAAAGDSSARDAETVARAAAAVSGGLGVVAGVPPASVDAPALLAHGLRPGQLLSRLGLSGGEPRPSASARTAWAESLVADGPASLLGAAVPGALPIAATTAPNDELAAVRATNTAAEGPAIVDQAALNGTSIDAAGRRPVMSAFVDAALHIPSARTTTLAAGSDGTSSLERQQQVAGPFDPTPALSGVRVPRGDTGEAGPRDASRLEAQRQIADAFVSAELAVQDPSTEAAPPVEPRARFVPSASPAGVRVLPADVVAADARVSPADTVTAGLRDAQAFVSTAQAVQRPLTEAVPPIDPQARSVPAASPAGVRVAPADTVTAGLRDTQAFASAAPAVQNPSTEAVPPVDLEARFASKPPADHATVDRRWTAGPLEDIAGVPADADRGISATAGPSATAGQSTGGDESNGRAFERRPPADMLPLHHAATRGATAFLGPERTTSTDAAQAMAEPTTAEPTADGAPLTHALVQSLKLQWRQGGGEARLRLQPDYLGELTVSLRVQGSAVTAVLQCDSLSVRTWVETHQAELRRALEEQGLSLDTITVDPEGHPQQQQDQSQQRNEQPRHWRRTDPGQFEAFL